MKKYIIIAISLILIVINIFMTAQSTDVIANAEEFNLSAKTYVVTDNNGKILVEKDAHKRREVASICKLMTTLLTLEKLEDGTLALDDTFIVSQYASDAEGSQAFLDARKSYKISDLLKSVVVASANDSAIVLAEGIAGSEDLFVKLMNDKASSLGMNNTRYANSTGLPALEQYSTAYDTSILLNVVSQYPLYKEYCKIWIDNLTHHDGRITELVNTNRMIKYYEYCNTGKTGFTDEAGYCLATTNTKNNLSVTCVVLGAESSANRFTESIELLNYTFANFKNQQIVFKDNFIENNISVLAGKEKSVLLVPENNYYVTNNINNDCAYEIVYDLPTEIKAPISLGDTIGRLLVTVNGEVIDSVNIVSVNSIDKQDYNDVLNKIIDNFGFIN